MSQVVKVHIDGVCQKQRGPGSWGVVMSKGAAQKEISGKDEDTTQNRAEMTALITALKALTRPCPVEVFCSSEYLIKGCCEWLTNWKRMGWKTSTQQPVRNADLWAQLDELFQQHAVVFLPVNEEEKIPLDKRATKLANKGLNDLLTDLKSRKEAEYNRLHQAEDGSIQKPVRIYTDGSCLGDKTGGWGAVIVNEGRSPKKLSGSELETTANRMEMLGVIHAIQAMPAGVPVRITVDSKYVKRGMEDWLKQWKQSGWITVEGEPVKNMDLWQRLDVLCTERHVSWKWVKSHSGHNYNEMADTLAREASALAAKEKKRMPEDEVCP